MSIAIYVFILLLFFYTVYCCILNWNLIGEITRNQNNTEYGITLQQAQTLYMINLVCCFLCFGVLLLFTSRFLDKGHFYTILNAYLAIPLILVLIVVSSWNLHLYGNVKDTKSHKGPQVVNGIILGLSCLIVFLAIIYFIYKEKIENSTSPAHKTAQTPKQQVAPPVAPPKQQTAPPKQTKQQAMN